MCIADSALLVAVRELDSTRVGRLDDGTDVSLAFVPAARPGDRLLLHLGIPVEVVDPRAERSES